MSSLFIVPTPIGNLEDITFRAIRILKEVDLILAEDTRNSGTLLKHFGIETKMTSYHQHNEHEMTPKLVQQIKEGQSMAVISDSGTPGISDAAYLLIRECIRQQISVTCLPGATAFLPALIVSGFPTNDFLFAGFLPQKKGRQSRLRELSEEGQTIILYESPSRLEKLLEELRIIFGENRSASVSRELTKLFEETKRGTLPELIHYFKGKKVKGEIVVVIEGRNKNDNQ